MILRPLFISGSMLSILLGCSSIAPKRDLAAQDLMTARSDSPFDRMEVPKKFGNFDVRFSRPSSEGVRRLEIRKQGETVFRTANEVRGGSPFSWNQVAYSAGQDRLGFLIDEGFASVSFASATRSDCRISGTSSFDTDLVFFDGNWHRALGDTASDDLVIEQIEAPIGGDVECIRRPFARVPHIEFPRRVVALRESLLILTDETKWGGGLGADTLREVRISRGGSMTETRPVDGFSLSGVSVLEFPDLREERIVLSLAESRFEDVKPRAVYLRTPDGFYRRLASNGDSPVWQSDGAILFRKGSHAGGHSLYRWHADGSIVRINLPQGYKGSVHASTRGACVLNEVGRKKSAVYEIAGSMVDGPVDLSGRAAESPNADDLAEVDYPSLDGSRRVLGLLRTPEGKSCHQLGRRPTIIYVHGGNFNSWGVVHRVEHAPDDPILLAARGAVVLETGYFGDEYFETRYRPRNPRYLDRERFLPQIQDVRAAIRYARTLPCVDTSKIVLYGHSYGAMIAVRLLTDDDQRDVRELNTVVLRGGLYSEKELRDFFGEYRLAAREGEAAWPNSGSIEPEKIDVAPILFPNPPVFSSGEALRRLTSRYIGVAYRVSSDLLGDIGGLARAHRIPLDIPILVSAGTDDRGGYSNAVALAARMREVSPLVMDFFPVNGGHEFTGEAQIEFLKRIENLNIPH